MLALVLLAGCGSTMHYPINAPLAEVRPDAGYRGKNFMRGSADDELLVILTFSGGGARAAALAYGVLEELARQRIVWRGETKPLLEEVDLVIGVSGGSITAAYWGLVGDRIFQDFEPRFLQYDMQERMIDRIVSLSNLWRSTSPHFGRGDLLAEELDEVLFHGATFAELASRERGPFVVISATELSTGARFDFTQETFDQLCGDLDRFPIARAVAASSAVPFLFSPITLWNRAGECGRPPGQAVFSPEAMTRLRGTRLGQRIVEVGHFADRERMPYLHLVDGGVADNLALRGLIELGSLLREKPEGLSLAKRFDARQIRRVLLISVDAGTESHSRIAQSDNVPRIAEVAEAMSDIVVSRYSDETRHLIRETIGAWRQRAVEAGASADDLPLHVVQVSLRLLADERERGELLATPTTLFLPTEQTRRLRAAAAQLMHQSEDWQRLVRIVGMPAVKRHAGAIAAPVAGDGGSAAPK